MEQSRLRRTIHIALVVAMCSIAFVGSKASADDATDVVATAPASSTHYAGPTAGRAASGIVRPKGSIHPLTTNLLTYHGGPVMTTSRVHLFFWDPSGTAFSSAYTNGILRYFRDLIADQPARSNVYSASTQYGAKYHMTNPALCLVHTKKCAKAWIIRDSYPNGGSGDCTVPFGYSACITDGDMRAELESIRTTLLRFPTGTTDISFVFLPQNVDTCFSTSCFSHPDFCAYHSSYSVVGNVVYANMPYLPGFAGCDVGQYPSSSTATALTNPADGEVSTISHEHNEALTDPLPGLGWFNGDLSHENGDQCAYVFDAADTIGFGVSPGTGVMQGTSGHFWDQKINHHRYLLQEEWSNKAFNNSAGAFGCVRHG